MKVLLVGSGAREHALAWKFRRSKCIDSLLLWPSSAALDSYGTKLPLGNDVKIDDVARMAKNMDVDFVVVGPEQPLADGLADACRLVRLPCFGPLQVVAQLESSKAFAKNIMKAAGIPTAEFKVVEGEAACTAVAEEFLLRTGGVVIKASGLASGKGVFVCTQIQEVHAALEHLYRSGMAKAAATIVIEEILVGRECSFFVFLGQGAATTLGFAVDYKRLRDGDLGPNTGGMGCYTPVPWLPADAEQQVMQQVVDPLLRELAKRQLNYTGCLYVGLMWGDSGPSVVEFNVRLGDPEAEVLAMHDQRDWAELIATKLGLRAEDNSFAAKAKNNTGATVAVTLASPDYPFGALSTERFELASSMLESREFGPQVFASAVRLEKDRLITGKGRILTVVGHAENFAHARQITYQSIEALASSWPGVQYRRDIGLGLDAF